MKPVFKKNYSEQEELMKFNTPAWGEKKKQPSLLINDEDLP